MSASLGIEVFWCPECGTVKPYRPTRRSRICSDCQEDAERERICRRLDRLARPEGHFGDYEESATERIYRLGEADDDQ